MSNLKPLLAGAALAVATLLPPILSSASAHEYEVGSLHIEHPWARATPPRAGVAGAYMVIENGGKTADRLLGANTDAARDVQIHSMTMDGGVMKMRQLSNGLDLPAGKTVTLDPGGYHLMLIDPVKPLKEGERVPMTLKFEKAGTVRIDLAVESMGAKGPEGGTKVGGHAHGMKMGGQSSSDMNVKGDMGGAMSSMGATGSMGKEGGAEAK